MKTLVSAALCAAALSVCAVPAVFAQTAEEPGLARLLVNNYRTNTKLTVTSPGLQPGGKLGAGFPGLAWTAGPAETKQYAVIVQDTDQVENGNPQVVFTIFNIPANITKIDANLALPEGARFGPSAKGSATPYATTPGGKHHYHFQVLALSANATANASKSFNEVMGGLHSNVVASGEIVGVQ